MSLPLLVMVPLIAGIAAWMVARWSERASRWICLGAFIVDFALLVSIWTRTPDNSIWMMEFYRQWVPQFGIGLHFGIDGLSLLMLLLSVFLGLIAVLTSWTEIRSQVGFFYFNLMWVMSGIIGIFISLDLFLFYFFWELMLVPMYFLIGIWGHENRRYAAFKFFLFTQGGGLLLLLAILGLYFWQGSVSGIYSFDYDHLVRFPVGGKIGMWLMLGFLASFLVKVPAIPFHTWLPDAHTEAPTGGSVILAGLLLKTGAYAILRFVLPIFPEPSQWFAPAAMVLGVIGIICGAVLAFAQTDFKRLVAYTSVSHMGFVMLGIYAFNIYGLQGAVMQMLCHGLSTGALFAMAGGLQERLHTRDMNQMGGFWESVPRMSGFAMFFAMASLGLPGLGNFVAEFLTLLGTWQVDRWAAALASIGLVFATVYSLWMIQRIFHGPLERDSKFADISMREWIIYGSMALLLVYLGLYPRHALREANEPLNTIQSRIERTDSNILSGAPSQIGFWEDNQ